MTRFDLIRLLPELYRTADVNGDLARFLSLPELELNGLAASADRLPSLIDLDHIDPRFLDLLASLSGIRLNPGWDLDLQRLTIRDAVPNFRRRATLPALIRDLTLAGWAGDITETFRDTHRLNLRAAINQAKLAGRINSLGVFRVRSDTQIDKVRDIIEPHHPAGTAVYFWQWLYAWEDPEPLVFGHLKAFFDQFSFSDLSGIFDLNTSPVNGTRKLTRRKSRFELMDVSVGTTLRPEPLPSPTCLAQWHRPFPGRLRTNRPSLNRTKFTNTWVSERKVVVEHLFTSQNREPKSGRINTYINGPHLPQAEPTELFKFRQRDLIDLQVIEPEPIDPVRALVCASWNQPRVGFHMGRSRLNQSSPLAGRLLGGHARALMLVAAATTSPDLAAGRVDRWQRPSRFWSLGHAALNQSPLTDAHVTDDRLALEVFGSTSWPSLPFALNRGTLNHRGLHLATEPTTPIRLGWGRLNQAGIRSAEQDYRWHVRQDDEKDILTPNLEVASTRFEVTRWPDP
ncbi:Phage tail protein (Tail_P2_I) [Sulfidibacter corallicola]|uniref:Phage tail protein n=1 Tax=Sulfidibacter corallicola TaxID=2818388 RepID=A0A8A4TJL6_SULCO|nr:hypothetical protein [Sulfidibacter corallicola]QTD49677.1 hypothetical protein J3U87_29185 [Sulfidibacter corallicola]